MFKKLPISTNGNAIVFNEEDVLNAILLSNGTLVSVAKMLDCEYHLAKRNIQYYRTFC